MLCYQSMHNETLRKNDRKENTYLIRVHIFFFANSLIESHYLDHPLLKQIFFVRENNFFYFQHHNNFLNDTFLFLICLFFTIFRLTLKNISLKKTNKTFISSFFLFKDKLSYYEKGTERKTFFLYFFRNSTLIFLF